MTEEERRALEAMKLCRQSMVGIWRKNKYGSEKYKAAQELADRIDDLAGLITGNRQYLHLKNHST